MYRPIHVGTCTHFPQLSSGRRYGDNDMVSATRVWRNGWDHYNSRGSRVVTPLWYGMCMTGDTWVLGEAAAHYIICVSRAVIRDAGAVAGRHDF